MKNFSPLLIVLVLGFSAPSLAERSYTNPAMSESFRNGSTLVEYEMYADAIRYLKQAEAEEPENADIKNLIAYSYRKLDQYKTAYHYYQQALALNPAHKGANEYLGELYVNIKRLDKAQEQLVKLKQICTSSCAEYKRLKRAIEDDKET